MRATAILLCLLTITAQADHLMDAFRKRPTDLNYNELDPSGGLYPKSDNPIANLKPEEIASVHDALSQEFPLFCRRNPPQNIHRAGVEAFRSMKENRRTEYDTQYEGLAKKALDQGRKAGGNLFRVAREFRFTKAGDEAALDNLSYLFQLSSFTLFAPYFAEFEKDHPDFLSACDDNTREWATRAFLAHQQLNKKESAARYAAILKRCDPSETETDRALSQKQETPPLFKPTLQGQFTREVLIYTGESSLCAEIEGCDPKEYCAFHAQFSARDTATLAELSEKGAEVRERYGDFVAGKIAASPRRLKDQLRFLTYTALGSDFDVAAVAANALSRFPSSTPTEFFSRLLTSPNQALFDEARHNLEAKGSEAKSVFEAAMREEKNNSRRHLLVNSYYMSQLNSEDDSLRESAVNKIDVLEPKALSRILTSLKDPNAKVRYAGVHRLLSKNRSEAKTTGAREVVPLLKDADEYVRATAIKILTDFGSEDPAVVAEVVKTLQSPDRQARESALEVLKAVAHEKITFDSLVSAIEDKDDNVRRLAYEVLKGVNLKYGRTQIGTAIEKLFPSKTPEGRLAAISLTSSFGERTSEAIPHLTKLLNDPDKRVAAAAAEQLKAIGP